MWKTDHSHQKRSDCQHEDVKSTHNAGLERLLCLVCGHVSVRYVEETIVDNIDLRLPEAELV